MKFIDEIIIKVYSGNGGNGCISFKREKFIPNGGPDGGDGGKGGDVILKSSVKRRTLQHLRFSNEFRARNGNNGGNKKKTGKSGRNIIINLPAGTVISDNNSGKILYEFIFKNDSFTLITGGKGGYGNAKFASSTNKSPKLCQAGEPGREIIIKLELKLLADVGIIGLPNAGKSTLLSAISSAKPKIGDYPFTTLIPNLGFVERTNMEPFVVADIPGIIEGAHKGVGLGIKFLKHIERSLILIHLVDTSTPNLVLKNIITIENELKHYSKKLKTKTRIFVLNKVDKLPNYEKINKIKKILTSRKYEVMCISALTLEGINNLVYKISEILNIFKKNK